MEAKAVTRSAKFYIYKTDLKITISIHVVHRSRWKETLTWKLILFPWQLARLHHRRWKYIKDPQFQTSVCVRNNCWKVVRPRYSPPVTQISLQHQVIFIQKSGRWNCGLCTARSSYKQATVDHLRRLGKRAWLVLHMWNSQTREGQLTS